MIGIYKPRGAIAKPAATYQTLTNQLCVLLNQYNKSLDPLHLEKCLREAMWYIDFVGELPLERGMFDVLTAWLQHRYVMNDNGKRKVLIETVQAATLVTSMVFSARYSDDEKRQFWDSYCRQVWGTTLTQSLSDRGRESFRAAARKLEKVTRMKFPISSETFVDYHVNRHALVPAYLHDDAANWLKKHLLTLIQVEPRQAASDLMNDPGIQYLAPRLQTFLKDETTRDIAVNLLEQMAVAVQRFHEGETAEAIADLLLNPIERSLWIELADVLMQQPKARQTIRRADIQWVWALLDNDWQLRIRNFFSGHRPIEAVWRSSQKGEEDGEVIADIQPWKRDDGLWYIDELLMTDGALQGTVSLYAAQNKQLVTMGTPPMPSGDFIIYRPTQQGQFAIPVDTTFGLSNGHWLISSEHNIEVRDADNQMLSPIQSDFYVPLPLREVTKHQRAALYRIDFPATIIVKGQRFAVQHRTDSIGQPWLTGKTPILLAPSVPPAFNNNHITLHFPDRAEDLIRLTLVIQTEKFQRRWNLEDVASPLQDVDDGCQLDLSLLIPFQAGVFTLDIQRGLRSVLPAPLQCAVLPDVSIIPPDETHIYWRDDLPSVWLRGVSHEQISNSNLRIKPDGDGWRVTWDDLRQSEFRLPIRFGEQQITLAWRLKRHYAFLDKLQNDQTVPLENLLDATLTIYGVPGETAILSVNGITYTEQFNGRRNADRLILTLLRHRLLGMIQAQEAENIPLDIKIGDHCWPIGTIMRQRPVLQAIPDGPPTPQLVKIQVQSEDGKVFSKQITERMSAIHRSDEWVEQYGLLPAWAVTGNSLLFCYTKGYYLYRLPIIPEVLAHRGQEGYGQVLLKLDGFRFERNYAQWKLNDRRQSDLRIKIPLQEPAADYSVAQLADEDLDEMWCAYQCRTCGDIIGNRLSSAVTHRHQQTHEHRQSEGVQFNDLFYEEPLRGQVIIEKWNIIEKPIVPYSVYFDPEWHRVCEQVARPIASPKHPLRLEAYQFATLDHVLRRSSHSDDYNLLSRHTALAQIRKKLKAYLKQETMPMLSAAVRFMDVLCPETSMDTQIVSLAVLNRLQELRDSSYQELEAAIGIDKRQNQQLMHMAIRICPELLLWAFSWVELFYIHAIA